MTPNKIVGMAMAVCFVCGMFLGWSYGRKFNQTTKTETQQTNTTRTVIKTIKDKSGREETVTTIDSKTDTKVKQSEIKPIKSAKTNISALAGNDFSKSIPKPIYGVSFSREFIGPITIGAFGFNNGVIGVSIGLNF